MLHLNASSGAWPPDPFIAWMVAVLIRGPGPQLELVAKAAIAWVRPGDLPQAVSRRVQFPEPGHRLRRQPGSLLRDG